MGRLGRTRVTPNMLTVAGIALSIAGAVVVYFEYAGWGFFWLGAALSLAPICAWVGVSL